MTYAMRGPVVAVNPRGLIKVIGAYLLFCALLQLGACATNAPPPQGPLPSSGSVAPPPACQALRDRGGSC